jgi:hypothetical protein
MCSKLDFRVPGVRNQPHLCMRRQTRPVRRIPTKRRGHRHQESIARSGISSSIRQLFFVASTVNFTSRCGNRAPGGKPGTSARQTPAPTWTSSDAPRTYPLDRPVGRLEFPGRMSGLARNHTEKEDWQVSMKAEALAFLLLAFAVGSGTSLPPSTMALSAKPVVRAPQPGDDSIPCTPYCKLHPNAPSCD